MRKVNLQRISVFHNTKLIGFFIVSMGGEWNANYINIGLYFWTICIRLPLLIDTHETIGPYKIPICKEYGVGIWNKYLHIKYGFQFYATPTRFKIPKNKRFKILR